MNFGEIAPTGRCKLGAVMRSAKWVLPLALILPVAVGGCGLFVPEKGLFTNDNVPAGDYSPQGVYENRIIGHIRCELREGVRRALVWPAVQWLKGWGATVTLAMSVDEMGALTPGATFLTPLQNAQTFTLGIGASGSAHTTRKETITFTLAFAELLKEPPTDCTKLQNGILIDSDLKIAQFIYDKSVIASIDEAQTKSGPPFSTFQEDITFVSSFGGNINPTWTLTRVTVNSRFDVSRGNTNDVLITLAAVERKPKGKAQLTQEGRDHHLAGLIGNATAGQNQSQAR